MQRREVIERFLRFAAKAMAGWTGRNPRIGLFGLTGMTLLLLMGAPTRPAEALDEALPHVSAAPSAVVTFSGESAASGEGAADHDPADRADSAAVNHDRAEAAPDAPGVGEDTDEAGHVPPAAGESSVAALEELLFMRNSGATSWKPATADEALAIAVANGSISDLEPSNPFRKRSRDIFRTNFRRVTIGRAEMLMRLRLRAKSRNAISVEVRF